MRGRALLMVANGLCRVQEDYGMGLVQQDLQGNYMEGMREWIDSIHSKDLATCYNDAKNGIMSHISAKADLIEEEIGEMGQEKTKDPSRPPGPSRDLDELRRRVEELRRVEKSLDEIKIDSDPSSLACDMVDKIMEELCRILNKHFSSREHQVRFSSPENKSDYKAEDDYFVKSTKLLIMKVYWMGRRLREEEIARRSSAW
jgi:hypothetical protein